jgi:hypothetical protein
MKDRTVIGYAADPVEVFELMCAERGAFLDEPDPLARYVALTQRQPLYDAVVSAIKRERGRALAAVNRSGLPTTSSRR